MEFNFICHNAKDESKQLSLIIDIDISPCFNCQSNIKTHLGSHNFIGILNGYNRDSTINSFNPFSVSVGPAININAKIRGFNSIIN